MQTLKLEVLIEKGGAASTSFPGFSPTRYVGRVGENPGNEVGAAFSYDANRTLTVCRTVEHMNFFY